VRVEVRIGDGFAVTKPGFSPPETVAATNPLGLRALREQGPGTARVRSIAVRAHETLVRLCYPNGREVVVALPDVAPSDCGDNEEPFGLIRPLAVLMRIGHAQVDSSVLGTSKDGPSRVAISVEQALTLCESGVHTVVRCE
jgi:hypothetical protein